MRLGALRYVRDCSEGRSIANGEVSQHLPVNGNTVALQAGNKDGVREPVQSSSSVDTVDPKFAHLALALLPITGGVGEGMEECLTCWTNEFRSSATAARGSLKQALVALMPRYSALDSCHALSPSLRSAAVRKQSRDLIVMRASKHRLASVSTDTALRLDFKVVPTPRHDVDWLPRACEANALLGSLVRLHLRHITPLWVNWWLVEVA
jgi:hypothetical protein